MKIAIIGAGWYGCHIGKVLQDNGFEITIFDQEDEIFKHASSKNQNRLHQGFHYPRSAITRNQSKKGHDIFINKYHDFCKPIKNNFYAVDDHRSIIDFETYNLIMEGTNLKFDLIDGFDRFKNLTGLTKNYESVIDFNLAKSYFEKELNDALVLNSKIYNKDIKKTGNSIYVNDRKFDFLINCTWGTFRNNFNIDVFYESCIVLLYKSSSGTETDFAITIMDGEFVSLYPYTTEGIYTLTSVKNTVLFKDTNYKNVENFNKNISDEEINYKIKEIEKEIIYYYPDFLVDFEYHDYFLTTKSKLNVFTDSREVLVRHHEKEIFVFSGKIDTIFEAEKEVLKIINDEK